MTMKSTVESQQMLKQLTTQLQKATAEAEAIKIEIAGQHKELSLKLEKIAELKTAIAKIQQEKKVAVSEHAILRYLERVKGLDIAKIKSEILTPEIMGYAEKLGDGEYQNNGFTLIIKNYTVVTIT